MQKILMEKKEYEYDLAREEQSFQLESKKIEEKILTADYGVQVKVIKKIKEALKEKNQAQDNFSKIMTKKMKALEEKVKITNLLINS